MADFFELISQRIGGEPPGSVYLHPSIPQKKLHGALTYAACTQEEVPLALFDDTAFGSAKAGALVTSHALYLSKHRGVRIPLEMIRMPPSFSEFEGTLRVADQTFQLPKMSLTESQHAWRQVFEVIVSINLGTASQAAVDPILESEIGKRAAHFLTHEVIALGARIPHEHLFNASTRFPSWCDWSTAESIVAFIDETLMGSGNAGIVLTDQRLLAFVEQKAFNIPYAEMRRVTSGGSFLKHLLVQHARGQSKVPLGGGSHAVDQICGFLNSVLQLPPEARVGRPPPRAPTDLPRQMSDPRALGLSQLLDARIRSGQLSGEQAADMLMRVNIFCQNSVFGRGQHGLWRISPLPQPDLEVALSFSVGQPQRVHRNPDGTLTVQLPRAGGGVSGAVISSAIGLTAFAVFGSGWVSTPGRLTTGILLTLGALGPASGFFVATSKTDRIDILPLELWKRGQIKPLVEVDPSDYRGFVEMVSRTEALALLARMLWGWTHPLATLYEQTPEVMQSQAHGVLPGLDISSFFAEAK